MKTKTINAIMMFIGGLIIAIDYYYFASEVLLHSIPMISLALCATGSIIIITGFKQE